MAGAVLNYIKQYANAGNAEAGSGSDDEHGGGGHAAESKEGGRPQLYFLDSVLYSLKFTKESTAYFKNLLKSSCWCRFVIGALINTSCNAGRAKFEFYVSKYAIYKYLVFLWPFWSLWP